MGQCFGSFWKRSAVRNSNRSKEYINASDLIYEEGEVIFANPGNEPKSIGQKIGRVSQRFNGIFSLSKNRTTRPSGGAYLLQDNEDDSHIELYDMVADPQFFTTATTNNQQEIPKGLGSRKDLRKNVQLSSRPRPYQSQQHQPDLRQVVGLRNTLTCCVLPSRQHYGKLDNEESDGGAAFIILNPRNLNGHATIPAPPPATSLPLNPGLSHSKWSVNSNNSVEESEKGRAPSIDLEWENDDDFVAAAAKAEICNDNNRVNNKTSTCDLDTCSISTNVPCNKGSRTSSHISLPGLDWDSQVDNDDLVSLNNPAETATDFETEQLISEIELLTSRALQETHQWGHSPSKKPSHVVEANNNPMSSSVETTWIAKH